MEQAQSQISALPELIAALAAIILESGRSKADLDPDISGHAPLIAGYNALGKAGYATTQEIKTILKAKIP